MRKSLSKFLVLITIICMDLLTGTEFDLFVPSFPQLQAHFNLTSSWVEASLSINFIGFCFSLIFVGGLADRWGRRPVILWSLIIFVIGSIICLYTQFYSIFLLGRFFQGMGVAGPSIISFLIIADSYPLKEQQYLMAMLNGVMNFAAAMAPVVGSYLTLYFKWQGNFMALLILGLITLIFSFVFIPAYKLSSEKESISLRGYIPIFQSKPIMLMIINMIFLFSPYWLFVGISPLLYIKDLNVSLTHFGFYQGVLAFVFAIGCILYGFRLKSRDYEAKKMLLISAWILIASLLAIILIASFNSASPLLITLAMLAFVIGQIVPSTILYPLCINLLPHAKGRISAVIQGGKLVITSFGLQLIGYYYQGSFQNVGLIISSYIIIGIITLFWIINNRQLMQKT